MQREFGETQIAWMTFALYIGLIIGAAGWGILADIIGRRPAFNATLGIAGIFSIAAGAAPNFVALGGLLAALGIGLGGNLPVDGMLVSLWKKEIILKLSVLILCIYSSSSSSRETSNICSLCYQSSGLWVSYLPP